jgi:hypothetical protein
MNRHNSSRLAAVRIAGGGEQCESLVLALQAVLRAYGREVGYDELAGLTGVAFMTTRAIGEPDPGRWPAHGRHAFLVPAARMYGLELRELHPPDAAPLPVVPPEFAEHFRDSYEPFIVEAMARDEPVLAWMGWPSPHEMQWGIITAVANESRRCFGCTAGLADVRSTLTGPPVQVYVAQNYTATEPESEDVLQAALARAAIILGNRLDPSFGVVTGPAALAEWRGWLMEALDRKPDVPATVEFHSQLARVFVSGRRTAARFFEKYHAAAARSHRAAVEVCRVAFREAATLLEPSATPSKLGAALESDASRQELVDALARVIECEQRVELALK